MNALLFFFNLAHCGKIVDLVFFATVAVTTDEAPKTCSQGCTSEWTNDEYPELFKGFTTFKESRTD